MINFIQFMHFPIWFNKINKKKNKQNERSPDFKEKIDGINCHFHEVWLNVSMCDIDMTFIVLSGPKNTCHINIILNQIITIMTFLMSGVLVKS